ncbi:hypothetical protein FHS31_001649 [Sphingomonas vulcanisoli]|uniref:Phasin family protein n=1 Tax=Sphingomonas vulcanisoli TaxID=1658060 RepID=A0ABX0TTH3_9SPHN|nr:hypothetical protein [Sphingomonas vulcanisoli]NIJ08039.1 hypothetical protein [Sphingomonas vulcanisoli]
MTNANASHIQLVPAGPSLAARMQTELKQAEAAFDSTAGLAGELIAKTIRAAEIAGIHRVHIQKHLKQLTASIDHALEGQMELQRFHQACRGFMKNTDLNTVGFGDLGDTPDATTPPSGIERSEPATALI